MSKNKSTPKVDIGERKLNPPKDLSDCNFYGLDLDVEQKDFRDAIWAKNKDIIFCDAKAGTGKTLVSVATAYLLYSYGFYDGIVYVVSPTQEEKIGFLPGTADDKISPYISPLKDALVALNLNPETSIAQENIQNQKNGTSFIECVSHLYLRGTNFNNKIIIIDEAQNMYLDELRKTLTRVNDDCKTIVIGHSGQCDIYTNPERSGFLYYKEWYRNERKAQICELHINHRGWVSNHADNIDIRAIYDKLAAERAAKDIEIVEKAKTLIQHSEE